MTPKRRRSQRQTIELEELKNDPNSLLSWGVDDPTLRKLETYRLYQTGYVVADIAEAFGFAHGYLYSSSRFVILSGLTGYPHSGDLPAKNLILPEIVNY